MAVPLCFRILINTEFIILIFFIGNCHDIMHGDSGFVHSKIRPGGLDPSPSPSPSPIIRSIHQLLKREAIQRLKNPPA